MFAQFKFKQKQEPIYVVFDKSDEGKKFLDLLQLVVETRNKFNSSLFIMNTKLLKRNQKFRY
jgi:hypothetical protein